MNVLFIAIDDLRKELGCYGVDEVITPNFDRLAEQGLLFHNAYAQYPVCNPSRASFLLGMRPDEIGITSNTIPFRDLWPDIVTLPQKFRESGYFTAGLGKIFHLAQPRDGKRVLFEDPKSFDHFYDGTKDATKLGLTGVGRDLTNGELKWCKWLAAEGDDLDQKDGQIAREAVEILEKHKDEPFFIGLGFHKPHDPFYAPKKYFDLYPEGSTKLVVEPEDRSPRVPLAIPNEKQFAKFTDQERMEFKRAYHACTSFTDAQLGKVLAAMDRLELWDNTIIILIGDHGYHLGEQDWWNKVTVYERCASAPMMVWVPGAKGMGKETEAIVEFVDFYPTLLDLTGLKAPHNLSGKSFRSVLEDPDLPGKRTAFTQVTRGSNMGRSVRTKRWRYTEWGKDGELGKELYDHTKDKEEYYNLASNPEAASVIARLKKVLDKGFPENEG
jgi:arylsulfatase A-like enzyme